MCWLSALSGHFGYFRRSRPWPHAYCCFISWWFVRVAYAVVFIGDGLTHFGALVSWFLGFLVSWWVGGLAVWFVVRTDFVGGSRG